VAAGHEHHHEPFAPRDVALSTTTGIRATWISLGILGATALVQLAIVAVSGSVALLADTIHNATDALTAIPLLLAFWVARRPPTRRYPYGLHRAEDLAGVAIVLMILASAILAGAEAFDRLLDPREPDRLPLVLAAGIVGLVGNESVARYRISVGRRIGSAALVADGLHARTDGFTSLGVILSAIASAAGVTRADAVIGLAITLVIGWTLVRAARSVLHRILDGTDEATIALIEEVSSSVPGVEHVSDVKARWTGHRLRAELNVDVDAAISVEQGHDIAELVRRALLTGVPRLDAVAVHVDPHEHDSHEPTAR
jgi:cation diffusion facilitator family transporter